jgi:hypothetical protein
MLREIKLMTFNLAPELQVSEAGYVSIDQGPSEQERSLKLTIVG